MQDEGYNGWENYPTWAVNLWIGNDEGSYAHWREQAEQALVSAAEDKADRVDFPRSATAILAENLREHVRRNTEPMRATLGADLIGYALDCVNWHEIADALVEIAREESLTA